MPFQQYPSKAGIPSGNTAARPSNPVIGDTYYDGTLGFLLIWDGTKWIPCSAPAGIPTVTAVDVGTSRAYTSGAIAFTFTAGTNGLQIFITQPAEQAVYQEVDGSMKLIGGIIEVSLDGTESGTPLPNVAFQAFSTINSYMQSNMQKDVVDYYIMKKLEK